MLRVLHVYRTYYPDTYGGIEEVISQLCRNTPGHGVENRVFCLSPDPTPPIIEHSQSQVHRSKRAFEVASCGFSFSALKRFEELVDWADVVNFHFPWPFGDILHLLSKKKKPSLLTYHSDIVRQKNLLRLYTPLMHKFLGQMDTIVAASPNYFATSSTLSRYSDKVNVIPYGLDPESYPKVDPHLSQQVREAYGTNYFLFIGSLRYYKGLHILLEAIQGTDLPVVIAGAGPTEANLKSEAQKNQLDNITFIGKIDSDLKVALLENTKGIVFPSHLRSEAFGVTLLEGLMFGKPLISCEIGTGTSYVNQHGETGYVIPPSDAKSLREAMLSLNSNKKMAQEMGQKARNRFETLFTGEMMGASYAKVYHELGARS